LLKLFAVKNNGKKFTILQVLAAAFLKVYAAVICQELLDSK